MRPFRHFLLFLLCLTKCSTAIAGDQSTGFDIHCNLFYGSLILAPVMVNGFGPYDFVLDTGTSATIIDSKLAAQLPCPGWDVQPSLPSRILPRRRSHASMSWGLKAPRS